MLKLKRIVSKEALLQSATTVGLASCSQHQHPSSMHFHVTFLLQFLYKQVQKGCSHIWSPGEQAILTESAVESGRIRNFHLYRSPQPEHSNELHVQKTQSIFLPAAGAGQMAMAGSGTAMGVARSLQARLATPARKIGRRVRRTSEG